MRNQIVYTLSQPSDISTDEDQTVVDALEIIDKDSYQRLEYIASLLKINKNVLIIKVNTPETSSLLPYLITEVLNQRPIDSSTIVVIAVFSASILNCERLQKGATSDSSLYSEVGFETSDWDTVTIDQLGGCYYKDFVEIL